MAECCPADREAWRQSVATSSRAANSQGRKLARSAGCGQRSVQLEAFHAAKARKPITFMTTEPQNAERNDCLLDLWRSTC